MQVQCPRCNKLLDASDQMAGQVVSCPSCGGQMQLPAAAGPAPAAPLPGAGPAGPGEPTKSCPYCGEQILAAAQKCRHCGSMLYGPGAGRSAAAPAPAAQGLNDGIKSIIFGGVGFVVCGLAGPVAIYYALRARQVESERTLGNIGLALGIIGLVIAVAQVLVIGGMIASGGH